jgi:hypothetical protein
MHIYISDVFCVQLSLATVAGKYKVDEKAKE